MLLQQVESLLKYDSAAAGFLETPGVRVAAQAVADSRMMRAGDRLGTYSIVAHAGSGGMGDVYHARDTRLERDVAIRNAV